ncbi:hypothetical protein [Streptomyces sp. NPDC058394]|uniref:hypothetical protein n=1 Tax=Streptomyces sp. NPDC058394 TaxID=3346477 RepID=UPI0036486277
MTNTGAQQLRCDGGDEMDLTAGTRTTVVSGAIVLAVGLAIVLWGVITNDIARSVGGVCLTMTSLTLSACVAIRGWVTDTSAERARLGDSQRETDADRMRYVAAQAALEVERQRLQRDAAAEREQLTARLKVEREAMRTSFEEQRAKLILETFETTARMVIHEKLFDQEQAPTPGHGRVIEFPEQPAREQARERGVSRP